MNDAQELHYARKVAARVAARLLKVQTSIAGKNGAALLGAVADESYRYWEWDRYFIVCFTENGDQLSQWRAYANDGLGYAVGFRSSAHWSTGFTRPVLLERVIYDETEQDARQRWRGQTARRALGSPRDHQEPHLHGGEGMAAHLSRLARRR